jgi:hypothetical protein
MDISGLNKAEVLAALFNGSRQQGLGILDKRGAASMTTEHAQEVLDNSAPYFDYLYGRVMKIDLSGDELRTASYNRDNGPDAAEKIIDKLRAA